MQRHLDPKHPHAVASFIASVLEFLPAKERKPYQKLMDDIRQEIPVPQTELTDAAYAIGMAAWAARRAHLTGEKTTASKKELAQIQTRLKTLREVSAANKRVTDLEYPKIDEFEDRLYFGGETIPLEILDEEIKFALDDVEIPPEG